MRGEGEAQGKGPGVRVPGREGIWAFPGGPNGKRTSQDCSAVPPDIIPPTFSTFNFNKTRPLRNPDTLSDDSANRSDQSKSNSVAYIRGGEEDNNAAQIGRLGDSAIPFFVSAKLPCWC